MTTLTLQVESPTLVEQLKAVLQLMRGVTVVDEFSADSAFVSDVPNATTIAAMHEAESGNDAGKVCTDSMEAFIASME